MTLPACRLHAVAEAPPAHDTAEIQACLAELGNLGEVDAGLLRCAQPTAEGFREAKRRGVRTVVNLRSSHSDHDLLRGTGLRYVEIPARQWSIGEAEIAAFLRVATAPESRPVLVHCAQGCDRTGLVVAAYRVVVEGWSKEAAIRELERFGGLPLWRNLRRTLRALDVGAMRARVGLRLAT